MIRFFFLHMTISFFLLFCACDDRSTENQEETKQIFFPKIALSFIHNQTHFMKQSIQCFQELLKNEKLESVLLVADHNPDKQYQQIKQVIQNDVDGIVCYPQDARTVIPMIKLANQNNIPIVVYARPPAVSSAKSVSVVSNNFELGKQIADALIKQINEPVINGIIFSERFDELSAINRRDGIISALEDQTKDYDVQTIYANPYVENATETVQRPLSENEHINLIISTSGAYASILQPSLKKHVDRSSSTLAVGLFDGDESVISHHYKYIDAVAVQDVEEMVQKTVKIMLDLINQKETSHFIEVDGTVKILKQ